ncbi:MAG: LytTR family DNA-binding domain-containing protein [Oscillospiraceae bacterium]
MNIAVVDDSAEDRAQLINNIKKFAKDNAVLIHFTEYTSGEEFLANAFFHALDAVFLDIFMDSMDGMNVAQEVRRLHQGCRIIFITKSPDFAIKSYDVRAFYYILKPFTYDDVAKVLNMLDIGMQQSSRFIDVKEGREWCKILLTDILYVDYHNHYVLIHTASSIVSTYMKFSEIEEKLSIYSEFLTCYRSLMVNMNKISKVDDMFFLLCNGEYIPINRKQVREIKAQYADYAFGEIEKADIYGWQ